MSEIALLFGNTIQALCVCRVFVEAHNPKLILRFVLRYRNFELSPLVLVISSDDININSIFTLCNGLSVTALTQNTGSQPLWGWFTAYSEAASFPLIQ